MPKQNICTLEKLNNEVTEFKKEAVKENISKKRKKKQRMNIADNYLG